MEQNDIKQDKRKGNKYYKEASIIVTLFAAWTKPRRKIFKENSENCLKLLYNENKHKERYRKQ